MLVGPQLLCSGGHGPLTSPQASARTCLWFVCLWFPGKRVGRKGLPLQDSQAGWLTWEVMLGSVGGRECSLEEGAQGREGRLSRKGLLGSWRTGKVQKAQEKKPTPLRGSRKDGRLKWGVGDWETGIDISTHQTDD